MKHLQGFYVVGVAGFEPATSSSQTRRDNRATLHPEESVQIYRIDTIKQESYYINKNKSLFNCTKILSATNHNRDFDFINSTGTTK